jgi:hypothetical protein
MQEKTKPESRAKRVSYYADMKQKNRRRGKFRSVRDGPKSADGQYAEPLDAIAAKDEGHRTEKPGYVKKYASENALIYIAQSDKQQDRMMLTAHKDDEDGHLNSRKDKQIDLNRAQPKFKKAFTTLTESMDESFMHRLKPEQHKERFYQYLEATAKSSDAEALKKLFPFLSSDEDRKQLEALKARRHDTEGMSNAELSLSIETLQQKIYDDQLKRALFKKRVLKLLESDENAVTTEETSNWLWLLLKRLKVLLDELKDDEEA